MDLFGLQIKIGVDSEDVDKSLKGVGGKLESFGSKLKGGLKTAAKLGGAAIAAFSTAAVAIGKQSMDAYADYEQLLGGVETLFGANGKSIEEYAQSVGKSVDAVREEYDALITAQDNVLSNAQSAYKNMGMSANEYMETVTGFAAALNQSLGGDTVKSAEYADRAITDMADNASKMGTSIDSIQTAYAGFSKQNYTMLDNLKLGYGGTKEEMERLIRDAERMDKSFSVTHKKTKKGADEITYSYADIVDAIHIVQKNMGISGNAAAEASKTIRGSLAAAKASWQNLVTGMADDNANLDSLINDFMASVTTAGENILPRVETILGSLVQLITQGATTIVPQLINVIINNLPILIEGGTQLLVAVINGIVAALPQLIEMLPQIVQTIGDTLKENWPAIKAAGSQLLQVLWEGIGSLGEWLLKKLQGVWDSIKEAFGKVNWAELGTKLINLIADEIVALKDYLAEKIPELWESFKTKWDEIDWAGLGTSLIDKISGAISDAKDTAWEKLKGVADNLKKKFGEVDWAQLGTDLINGVISGITNAASNLYKKIKEIIKNGLKAGQDEAETGSPSKLFARELGQWIPAGIAMGAENNSETLTDAVRNLIDGSLAAATAFTATATPALAASGAGSASGAGGLVINQYIESVPQTPVELASATEAYFEQARWAI